MAFVSHGVCHDVKKREKVRSVSDFSNETSSQRTDDETLTDEQGMRFIVNKSIRFEEKKN